MKLRHNLKCRPLLIALSALSSVCAIVIFVRSKPFVHIFIASAMLASVLLFLFFVVLHKYHKAKFVLMAVLALSIPASLLQCIAALLGIFALFINKGRRPLLIVSLSLYLLFTLLSLIEIIPSTILFYENGMYSFMLNNILWCGCDIPFIVAFLIYAIVNKSLGFVPVFEKLSPELKLKFLQTQKEDGLLSEEEYNTYRTEIINHL